jgi:hypothetical protein
MPRPRSRRDQNLRLHIAYLAARLMAEGGVSDYAAAKQKAARQAGLSDANLLPDNAEIEAALREYQGLYQGDEHPAHLRRLREIAVKVMREFDEFRPALVGAVLAGTAGPHSDINLQVYTDDEKALTLFLLNGGYRFEEGTRSVRRGGRTDSVPHISLEVDDVTVTLTVLDLDDERSAARQRSDDEPPSRARLPQLEALLEASAPP